MKHNLVHTLWYGIGAGICVATFPDVWGWGNSISPLLLILIIILFLFKEIAPHANSETHGIDSQEWNKILVFVLLASSSFGILIIYTTIEIMINPTSLGAGGLVIICTGPLALIYSIMTIVALARLFGRRSIKASSVASSAEESIENFSKLTYRQKFAIAEYGYLLSPKNAEVVGKMLGNLQDNEVLPFCQTNGKKVAGLQEQQKYL